MSDLTYVRDRPDAGGIAFNKLLTRIIILEGEITRQRAINEVLFGLIVAAPIGVSEHDKAREMFEAAIGEAFK